MQFLHYDDASKQTSSWSPVHVVPGAHEAADVERLLRLQRGEAALVARQLVGQALLGLWWPGHLRRRQARVGVALNCKAMTMMMTCMRVHNSSSSNSRRGYNYHT